MFGLSDNDQNDNSVSDDAKPAEDSAPAAFDDMSNEHQESERQDHNQPQADDKSKDDDLISLKEQALNSLSPLLSHLDQTPEEHFKTVMMLIQASDNAGLIKEAYQAANKIEDEKARAQALLDVVNEINYFTQKDDKDEA